MNFQLELITRLVNRLDEENKELKQELFKMKSQNFYLESELKELKNSNLELTKLLYEYFSLKNKSLIGNWND